VRAPGAILYVMAGSYAPKPALQKRFPWWLRWSTAVAFFALIGGVGSGNAVVIVIGSIWFIATMTFYVWTGAQEGPHGTKVCPDCAEHVRAPANVCKHCGYRWTTSL